MLLAKLAILQFGPNLLRAGRVAVAGGFARPVPVLLETVEQRTTLDSKEMQAAS
jgi:hypothetical protein